MAVVVCVAIARLERERRETERQRDRETDRQRQRRDLTHLWPFSVLSSVFNATFALPLSALSNDPVPAPENFRLKVHLFDWDRIGSNDFLGEVTLDLFRGES